jgi:hypothetical protein
MEVAPTADWDKEHGVLEENYSVQWLEQSNTDSLRLNL